MSGENMSIRNPFGKKKMTRLCQNRDFVYRLDKELFDSIIQLPLDEQYEALASERRKYERKYVKSLRYFKGGSPQ